MNYSYDFFRINLHLKFLSLFLLFALMYFYFKSSRSINFFISLSLYAVVNLLCPDFGQGFAAFLRQKKRYLFAIALLSYHLWSYKSSKNQKFFKFFKVFFLSFFALFFGAKIPYLSKKVDNTNIVGIIILNRTIYRLWKRK